MNYGDEENKIENLYNMSIEDILVMYARLVKKYDTYRDYELDIFAENPNRDMWDDEMDEYHDELVEAIIDRWEYIKKINRFIEKKFNIKL